MPTAWPLRRRAGDCEDIAIVKMALLAGSGVRREDMKLRDAFNKALGEMVSDGTYKKINEKYFPFPLN